jgi:transmembrane sensor
MNSSTWNLDPAADEQASLWAARLDGSELSAADRRELNTWLAASPSHRALLSNYCQFSADLEQQLPLLEGIKELSAEAGKSPETATLYPWLRWPRLAGAMLTAAAAVALVFWFARPREQTDNIATSAAHRQTLTLADGTRVELNAQTGILVEISHTARHVRLASGEAFFSVSKDPARPFIIETPAGSVRVTGTQFNVRTETSSALDVTVLEGTVQVRAGEASAPVALTASQALASGPAGIAVRTLSPAELSHALAWRQGQIIFEGTPLREALARFARYHGRGITAAPEAAGLRVGGTYSLDDLDGFLSGLEAVLPVHVTRGLSGTVQVGLRNEQ